MLATLPHLEHRNFPRLQRARLETVQVNLGYRCNQQCLHCHVNAGPNRREEMTSETADAVLALLDASGATALDLTGGAPELNANFRRMVAHTRRRNVKVIDRCNLTVLLEPGQDDLAEFLAAQRVEISASLPCYIEENVNRQRGSGVFEKSIAALQQLNTLGYGLGTGLTLNLVFNPQGPSLPPSQQKLEADYKQHLRDGFGIAFDHLYTLANMPIQRFGSTLLSKGQFHDYMNLLVGAHQDENLETVMCRSLLSVDWQGYVYDCDFNQMLNLPLRFNGHPRTHVSDLIGVDLNGAPIVTRDHCYGCTAGQGSSCGGALA